MAESEIPEFIRLVVTSGPVPMEPVVVEAARGCVLGRSSGCDVVLEDPAGSVSRRHVEVCVVDGRWVAKDLGSRNGSLLNGERLGAEEAVGVEHGNSIQIGSWLFRVLMREGDSAIADMRSTMVNTLDDSGAGTDLFERVEEVPLARLASHRLAALLECSDSVHSAKSLKEAGEVALHALLTSTGYARGAYVVRGDEIGVVETLAFESVVSGEDVSSVGLSSSMLAMAEKGEVVRMSSSSASANDYGQSIAELEIHSALCIPVMNDEMVTGFLYLDARGREHSVSHDASSFGRAIGRLLGLTVANLRNKELEFQQHAMQYDLDAAGNAQRLLLPAADGVVGRFSYSMSMRPGRFVAGDLFGIVALDDGRVCVFLGDVSGKGAGAAIMMATTQSYIHAMLEQHRDLGELVTKLNNHIADRSHGGMFVTLWIGILRCADESGRSEIEFIDCGHGHWLVTRDEQEAARPDYTGGLVVGIAPGYAYQSERITLEKDQRLVVFSDGVVEQRSHGTDDEFGMGRTSKVLGACRFCGEDVARLAEQVVAHAGSEQLDDDMTIASIGVHTRAGSKHGVELDE